MMPSLTITTSEDVTPPSLGKGARSLFLLQALLFLSFAMYLTLIPTGWESSGSSSSSNRWLGGCLLSLAYLCFCVCKPHVSNPHGTVANVLILFNIYSVFVMIMSIVEDTEAGEKHVNVVLLMIFLGLTLVNTYQKIRADSLAEMTRAADLQKQYTLMLRKNKMKEERESDIMCDESQLDDTEELPPVKHTTNTQGELLYDTEKCECCRRRRVFEKPLRAKLKKLKKMTRTEKEVSSATHQECVFL